MKIMIPAVEVGNFDTEIHDNFGRANYFALFDTEKNSIEFVENTAASQSSGAGVAAAKAYSALSAAGIETYDLTDQKLLKEAYNDYKNGKLEEASPGRGGH